MDNMKITRETKIKDILKYPAGHDIIMKALYSLGLDSALLTKTPIGNMKISAIQKEKEGVPQYKQIACLS